MRFFNLLVIMLASTASNSFADESPNSTIVFTGDTAGHRESGKVRFWLFDNDRCEKAFHKEALQGLAAVQGKAHPSTRVDAGKLLYVRSLLRSVAGAGSSYDITTCVNVSSFTPEAGHTYHADMTRCALVITDNATGAAPPDLQRIPIQESCKP